MGVARRGGQASRGRGEQPVNNFFRKALDKWVFVCYIIVVERGITKCKIYQKAQSPSEVTTVFGKQ